MLWLALGLVGQTSTISTKGLIRLASSLRTHRCGHTIQARQYIKCKQMEQSIMQTPKGFEGRSTPQPKAKQELL